MNEMTWEELRVILNGIEEGEDKSSLDERITLSSDEVTFLTLVVSVANGEMTFIYASGD